MTDDEVGWGRYMRIRVAINLYQPLDKGHALLLTGKSCWVSFRYEKLPVFCFKCGRILHEPTGCTVKESKNQSHNKGFPEWGSWLRADDFSREPGLPEGHRTTQQPTSGAEDHGVAGEEFQTKGYPKKERRTKEEKLPSRVSANPGSSEENLKFKPSVTVFKHSGRIYDGMEDASPVRRAESKGTGKRKISADYGRAPQSFSSGEFSTSKAVSDRVKTQYKGVKLGSAYRPKSVLKKAWFPQAGNSSRYWPTRKCFMLKY